MWDNWCWFLKKLKKHFHTIFPIYRHFSDFNVVEFYSHTTIITGTVYNLLEKYKQVTQIPFYKFK